MKEDIHFMIRINQIKLPIEHDEAQLEQKILKTLKIKKNQLMHYKIAKKSIDARKKPELFYVYSVDVSVDSEIAVLKRVNDNNIMSTKQKRYEINSLSEDYLSKPPIIVGAGPAGLFAAYYLLLAGIKPIVLERGKQIEAREEDVKRFWETGVLDVTSNVQFGEGGAGTFSDGKLNTLVKDPVGRNQFVLETFVKYGAQDRILYENKPHIGTDVLRNVIINMRKDMIHRGCEFRFESCMTDLRIENNAVTAVQINHEEWIETDTVVLALGHSARDTFQMLLQHKLVMEPKAFAVGFRVEHPQEVINRTQYGDKYFDRLSAAPYKVTANLANGRGVYSFCMCPGGYVVNASSEEGRLAVNGMSYAKRDGKNANSAIIVSVKPEDFDGTDALSGVRFQQQLEEKAFRLAEGKIPQQLFGDYCKNVTSTSYGNFSSETKGHTALCNLRGLLPQVLEESFIEGMHAFSRSIPGYDREDAILSGIESRTSSPVRICRDEQFLANIDGIYPCGEGAGYAGGIMSAAMDGLKVAEHMVSNKAGRK